jgi:hypothetical protein
MGRLDGRSTTWPTVQRVLLSERELFANVSHELRTAPLRGFSPPDAKVEAYGDG